MKRVVLFALVFGTSVALAALVLSPSRSAAPRPAAATPSSSSSPPVSAPAPSHTPRGHASVPSANPVAEPSRIDPRTEALCPEHMVLVDGSYCPYVGHRCAEWISEKRDRCARYVPPPICEGRRRPLTFCIDRMEYPNQEGVLPAVMVDWVEARDACRLEGKRLCTESEWNFACEGAEMQPFPYGWSRDASACNIDRSTAAPDLVAFDVPRRVSAEVARLDQREPSGARPKCVSPFGVLDMTGNVDEWVARDAKEPDVAGLKGGYFGKIRARCRPMTTDHNRWFRFYQVGFRCCRDPLAAAGLRRPGPEGTSTGPGAGRVVAPPGAFD